MKHAIFLILRAFLILTFVLSTQARNLSGGEKSPLPGESCNIHEGPCSKKLGTCTVTLEISPKPVKAMKELTFAVTLEGSCPSGVPVIDLSMPGMVMGENKVILKNKSEGVFQGAGVIVRCPSGRKTWQATVIIPDQGSVDFIFDVIY